MPGACVATVSALLLTPQSSIATRSSWAKAATRARLSTSRPTAPVSTSYRTAAVGLLRASSNRHWRTISTSLSARARTGSRTSPTRRRRAGASPSGTGAAHCRASKRDRPSSEWLRRLAGPYCQAGRVLSTLDRPIDCRTSTFLVFCRLGQHAQQPVGRDRYSITITVRLFSAYSQEAEARAQGNSVLRAWALFVILEHIIGDPIRPVISVRPKFALDRGRPMTPGKAPRDAPRPTSQPVHYICTVTPRCHRRSPPNGGAALPPMGDVPHHTS